MLVFVGLDCRPASPLESNLVGDGGWDTSSHLEWLVECSPDFLNFDILLCKALLWLLCFLITQEGSAFLNLEGRVL